MVIAHVTAVQNTNGWGKAGGMLRDGSAADTAEVLLAENPNSQAVPSPGRALPAVPVEVVLYQRLPDASFF
jgi:hypothetical protein